MVCRNYHLIVLLLFHIIDLFMTSVNKTKAINMRVITLAKLIKDMYILVSILFESDVGTAVTAFK